MPAPNPGSRVLGLGGVTLASALAPSSQGPSCVPLLLLWGHPPLGQGPSRECEPPPFRIVYKDPLYAQGQALKRRAWREII